MSLSPSLSMQQLPVRAEISASVHVGARGGRSRPGHAEARVCLCLRVCTRTYEAILERSPWRRLQAPVPSQNPWRVPPGSYSVGISWEEDLALCLLFVFLFGESRPHRVLLPFLLHHHPLAALSVC